ncbi:MAG: hypothetical protein QOG23_2011 [Blastocatellia bacterium]|jgi:hypothetical protein|nr:hypothetical protein [Blastocatellia bacterium]
MGEGAKLKAKSFLILSRVTKDSGRHGSGRA